MIQHIERLLKKWGLISSFDANDVVNAEIEDKARDTQEVMGRIRSSLSRRFEANAALRHSIIIAKQRTNSFEQFERLMAGKALSDD